VKFTDADFVPLEIEADNYGAKVFTLLGSFGVFPDTRRGRPFWICELPNHHFLGTGVPCRDKAHAIATCKEYYREMVEHFFGGPRPLPRGVFRDRLWFVTWNGVDLHGAFEHEWRDEIDRFPECVVTERTVIPRQEPTQ